MVHNFAALRKFHVKMSALGIVIVCTGRTLLEHALKLRLLSVRHTSRCAFALVRVRSINTFYLRSGYEVLTLLGFQRLFEKEKLSKIKIFSTL